MTSASGSLGAFSEKNSKLNAIVTLADSEIAHGEDEA